MPKRQNQNTIGPALVMVQGDVTGIPERDDQFTQIGFFFQRAANTRLRHKQVELLANRLCCTFARCRTFFRKKLATSFQSASSTRGNDYS